jgi:hypothetical protein
VSKQVVDEPHASWPEWQGFAGVQPPLEAHGPQTPPLQTSPAPQLVPSGAGPMATHVGVPVVQSVRPLTHTPPLGVHGWFAAQLVHVPALQTAPVPQDVPFASGVDETTQVPDAQSRLPW